MGNTQQKNSLKGKHEFWGRGLKPLGDRYLLRPDNEPGRVGLIILPPRYRNRWSMSVASVVTLPFDNVLKLKVGDTVFYDHLVPKRCKAVTDRGLVVTGSGDIKAVLRGSEVVPTSTRVFLIREEPVKVGRIILPTKYRPYFTGRLTWVYPNPPELRVGMKVWYDERFAAPLMMKGGSLVYAILEKYVLAYEMPGK